MRTGCWSINVIFIFSELRGVVRCEGMSGRRKRVIASLHNERLWLRLDLLFTL